MALASRLKWLVALVLIPAAATFVPVVVSADHALGYHWKRTSVAEVVLELGDNVSSLWVPYLGAAAGDWDQSFDLDVSVVPGAVTPRSCKPKNGRIEVCNAAYGNNGWLGLARLWTTGLHITSASVQLNDTYFIEAYGYDTPAWRQFVTCQELGHVFGLDHTDEDVANPNQGTCMDYTSQPAGGGPWGDPNTSPNQHDYEELVRIYAHTDTDGSRGGGRSGAPAGIIRFDPDLDDLPSSLQDDTLGDLIRKTRRGELYRLNLGNGSSVLTFLIRA